MIIAHFEFFERIAPFINQQPQFFCIDLTTSIGVFLIIVCQIVIYFGRGRPYLHPVLSA